MTAVGNVADGAPRLRTLTRGVIRLEMRQWSTGILGHTAISIAEQFLSSHGRDDHTYRHERRGRRAGYYLKLKNTVRVLVPDTYC